MENFRNSEYRTRIEENLRDLEKQTMPEFDRLVQSCLQKLKKGEKINENEFRDTVNEIYDGVHEIWKSVVFGRDQSGYETDVVDGMESRSEMKLLSFHTVHY